MTLVANLEFLKDLELYQHEKPFRVFANIPKDAVDRRLSNLEFEHIETTIHDLREASFSPSLDNNAFKIREHFTRMDLAGYRDMTTVEQQYFPEIEQLLKLEDPSIHRVVFFDWRLRSTEDASGPQASKVDLNLLSSYLKPASEVHVDQTPLSALQRVQSHLGDDAEHLLRGRVRIINTWRPLVDPVEMYPLAFCDGSTVNDEDLIASDHVRKNYLGENYFARFQRSHKWYYLSEQKPTEVLLIKMFDSKVDVKAKVCPHAAFDLPDKKAGARPRRSIELRALVFSD